MRRIIWGTGIYGQRFAYSLGKNNFDCFIDIDKTKSGQFLFEKMIISPDILGENDWKNSFFYIPFNYKDEIALFLSSKGLRENENFQVYQAKFCCQENDAWNELKIYESELERLASCGISNLFIGMVLPKRGYDSLIRGLPIDTAVIIEDICGDAWNKNLLEHPVIKAPVFMDQFFLVHASEKLSNDKFSETESLQYIREAAEQIKGVFEGANTDDCRLTALLQYTFYKKTLLALNPKNIICIGSVSAGHRILKEMYAEQGMNIIFSHPGVLPGTDAFDIGGEVGESILTINHREFNRLPITPEDIELATNILNWLHKSGLNRKVQPAGGIPEEAEPRIVKGRPTILFMGQNDAESYMVPYNTDAKRYYSPIFESSTDAAIYLANLCEKNGWNFIYKPHPMYSHPEQAARLSSNTIFIEFGNINDIIDRCDVAVTILSSANYVALIRKKPVVMLGYNQIRGSGSCYEAYEEDRIEDAIKEALKNGFSEEQRKNFQEHVARLLKYHLYDDMQPRKLRYGKNFPADFSEIYKLKKLLNGDIKLIRTMGHPKINGR